MRQIKQCIPGQTEIVLNEKWIEGILKTGETNWKKMERPFGNLQTENINVSKLYPTIL